MGLKKVFSLPFGHDFVLCHETDQAAGGGGGGGEKRTKIASDRGEEREKRRRRKGKGERERKTFTLLLLLLLFIPRPELLPFSLRLATVQRSIGIFLRRRRRRRVLTRWVFFRALIFPRLYPSTQADHGQYEF